jgi:hypothetical protein
MNCTIINIRMDKEIPPYLEIKSATTRGPLQNLVLMELVNLEPSMG